MAGLSREKQRLRTFGRVVMGLALAGVIGLLVFLVREVRRVPTAPPNRERTLDVVVPRSQQHPWQPGSIVGQGGSPQSQPGDSTTAEIPIPPERQLKPVKRIMPYDLPDPHNPPQYTKPLAVPPENPVPPNPFIPPPINVNPDRTKGPAY